MTASTRDDELAAARPRLTTDERDMLLVHLVRVPGLFQEARTLLDMADDALASRLLETDPAFACLWRAALNVAARRPDKCLPSNAGATGRLIETEVRKLADYDPSGLGEAGLDRLFGVGEVPGVLRLIYGLPDSDLDPPSGPPLLRAFLEELTLFDRMQDYVGSWGSWLPTSFDAFVEQLRRQQTRLAGLGGSAVIDPFPEYCEISRVATFPTGVEFLDRFLTAGQALGDVHVLLATTGGGKTTAGVQLFVAGARYQQALASPTYKPGDWYYFNYEGRVDPDLLEGYLWPHAAQIDFREFRAKRRLSSAVLGDYKDYERERFTRLFAHGDLVPGEADRLASAAAVFERGGLWPVDCSGHVVGVGCGGIPEIAATLERDINLGRCPKGVVVDWAGLVVENYMRASNQDPKYYYQHIKSFVNDIRVEVAERFKVVVWVLHQLHGDQKKKSPTTKMSHTDALGARNFADSAVNAFVLGNLDQASGCMRVWASKGRYVEPDTPPAIIRMDGAVRTMIDASDTYAVHPASGEFVLREDLDRVDRFSSPTAEAKKRPKPLPDVRFGSDY